MKSLVSVIIPFYKNAKWLGEALDSVIKQSYKNLEIILINDGSEDDLEAILEKYKERLVYIKQENRGAAAARNKGIAMATGEYIAFLDSDDIWEENKIEIQLKEMIVSGAVWSHTNYYRMYENEKILETVNLAHFKGNVSQCCLCTLPIATPCVMIRTEVLKNNKYKFHEAMKFGEDLFLWANLANNYQLNHINLPLTKVRIRGSNASLRAYSQIKGRAELWNNLFCCFKEQNKQIDRKIEITYKYCRVSFSLIEKITDENLRELFAKFIYFPAWLAFKAINKKILRGKNV